MPPQLVPRGKIAKLLTIQDKLGLLLYLSINRIMKRLERLVFVLFTSLMCSDSIFNLLKRVADGSFYLLQNVDFSFSTLLEFGRPNLGVPQIGILTSNQVQINPCCTICDIFFNSILTEFCELDIPLCFNVLDYNVGLTPSVFKKVFWTILTKNKVKIVVNIP